MTQAIRPQPSGAANRARAKAREAAGQLKLKLVVPVMDYDSLVASGDLSEDDLATFARFSAGMGELLPDMTGHYAKRLEESQREPSSLYRLTLPGSRTPVGEARAVDLELARHEIRRQAFELACLNLWLELIAKHLATGKCVQDAVTLDQLRHEEPRPNAGAAEIASAVLADIV